MGKPRMIILIRHAQSEGNKNRDIHQYVPDHRVKLTPDGQAQAEDAGRRLRALLKPDDTIQFFTSPYRRTRETTEGILKELTSNDEQLGPSPFPRDKIKVYEEPRLREQDFGNFQPCSAEMERMWQERADYGHFFYRIANGESAADAYDRVAGFNESLWRQFGDEDFPSVCVLVTHGLMTRVFLMKWYHWSVEYFEDLRNINHCEFIVMKQNHDNGKFILQNELRTWSEMKRKKALENAGSVVKKEEAKKEEPPRRMWGGCAMGCDHAGKEYPRRPKRQNTTDSFQGKPIARSNDKTGVSLSTGKDQELDATSTTDGSVSPTTSVQDMHGEAESDADDADHDSSSPVSSPPRKSFSGLQLPPRPKGRPGSLLTKLGRDGGGSHSGIGSPNDISDEADDSDWFDTNVHQFEKRLSFSQNNSSSQQNLPRSELSRSALSQINEDLHASAEKSGSPTRSPGNSGRSDSLSRKDSVKDGASGRGGSKRRSDSAKRRNVLSEQEMLEESGMDEGRRADALGDAASDEQDGMEADIDARKMRDRKSLSEVY